jgi:hypothetical protein
MSTGLAALVAVAAVTVTYFFHVRPMRRSSGCSTPPGEKPSDRELTDRRAELDALRAAQFSRDRGRRTDE